MLYPDILALIKFKSTSEGGRKSAVSATNFGCLFEYKGELYDCKLLLEQVGVINPGDIKLVPIKFLNQDFVKNKICKEEKFFLKESKIIAQGLIKEIF